MPAPCVNQVVCGCDSPIFTVGNPTVASSLSGLMWQLPIFPVPPVGTPPYFYPNAGPCTAPPDQISGLAGAPNRVYAVNLLFRGICELGTYTGGAIIGGTTSRVMSGGIQTTDGHNRYFLAISDPPALYYLNNWNGVESYNPCYLIRYNLTVQIRTGATLTLHCDTGADTAEVGNSGNIVVNVLGGEPPLRFLQNPIFGAAGQVLQVDVLSIT